jgi:hypothetical protein
MTRKDIQKSAREAAEALKNTGREALAAARDGVSDAASEAAAALHGEAESRAEAGKDMVADQGQRLADDLREAAQSRGGDSFQGRLLDTVASGVEDVSAGLRGRTLSSIIEQTEAFARRNPGAFVAGAAIAGFALARFARASGASRIGNDDHTYSTGHHAASKQETGNILASVQRRAEAERSEAGAKP